MVTGRSTRVLVVRDVPEVHHMVANPVARYDVSPKQVRLELHLPLRDNTVEPKGQIWNELAPLVKKFQVLFRYKEC